MRSAATMAPSTTPAWWSRMHASDTSPEWTRRPFLAISWSSMASGIDPTPNWMVEPSAIRAAARSAMGVAVGSFSARARASRTSSSASTRRSKWSSGSSPAPKV